MAAIAARNDMNIEDLQSLATSTTLKLSWNRALVVGGAGGQPLGLPVAMDATQIREPRLEFNRRIAGVLLLCFPDGVHQNANPTGTTNHGFLQITRRLCFFGRFTK